MTRLYKLTASSDKGDRIFYTWASDEQAARDLYTANYPFELKDVARVV